MRVLAICGSIRKDSSNHALLKAIHGLVPGVTDWTDFDIKQLPFFDPQLQFSPEIPAIVSDLRRKAHQSNFIVISTPEYAHGIPGILKNALEWLLCEETMKKKVAIFIGAPSGGEYVKEFLLETLQAMDMVATPEMTLVVRTARNNISSHGEILDSELRSNIRIFLQRIMA